MEIIHPSMRSLALGTIPPVGMDPILESGVPEAEGIIVRFFNPRSVPVDQTDSAILTGSLSAMPGDGFDCARIEHFHMSRPAKAAPVPVRGRIGTALLLLQVALALD